MRKAHPTLTPHELNIMKLVWEREEATVRDVYEALRARRRIAYTSVLTMMNVLERKGHLRKRAEGRSFVYQAARPRGQVVRAMVREFVQRVFNGAAEPLLVHLLEDRRLTPKERQELRRLIEEAE
jgi:predicted transcriptional regulator